MTNADIIFGESVSLAKEGMLQVLGNGLPEPIHSYKKWNELGYQVKKGEKAIAKFKIWKPCKKKKEDNDADYDTNMYLVTTAFFKPSQVERIEVQG